MKRSRNASLKPYNSFSVEARAARLVELESPADIDVFVANDRFDSQRDLILGGGSNILLTADIDGSVVLNHVKGKRIVEDSGDEVIVEANAGENWHQLVQWSLDQGLSGIENLSLIPGLAGAAPMQNIGAYGVELADVLVSVKTVDLLNREHREFKHAQCRFAYRDSRFKSADAGRYLITAIRLRLNRVFRPRLGYSGIAEELASMGIETPNARQVSDAVIRIRQRKLPDPAVTGNAGSFFKNPVVDRATSDLLVKAFPGLPAYANGGQAKLSAAWMIEKCGWKGRSMGQAAVSERHALVLINKGAASGVEILALAEAIRESVLHRFEVELQPEPLIIRP
jgi:UDP-N-acetylmuramate dehydrogenase